MNRRSIVILMLLMAILACVAMLPWGRWLQAPADPGARLTECVARYVELRKQEDWQALYALSDARDRAKIARPFFLTYYGSGILKVRSLTEKSREMDVGKGVATVKLEMDGELDYDSLPARYKASLQRPDPAALKKTDTIDVEWSWSAGTWWMRMDRPLLTGQSPDGKPIKLEQGPQPEPANGNGDKPKK